MGKTEKNCRVIVTANQKGGVGKTTVCVNLGIGLARAGKKVCLIDADAQGSMSASLGVQKPDSLDVTLAEIMEMIVNGDEPEPGLGILHHGEGVDFMPANIGLAGVETALVNVMSRETVLRQYIDSLKGEYEYILVDTMPSLGMLTINALAAADTVLVPLQTQFLSLKGLEQLIVTILKVKKQINPRLDFEGILMTMVDARTNYSKEIMGMVGSNYGKRIPVFQNYIPMSVRAAETSAVGKSIYLHDPKGKAAAAFEKLTEEVLAHGE